MIDIFHPNSNNKYKDAIPISNNVRRNDCEVVETGRSVITLQLSKKN